MVFHRGFWHKVTIPQPVWTKAQQLMYGKVYLMALDKTDSEMASQSLAEAFVFKTIHKEIHFHPRTEQFLRTIFTDPSGKA
jgi:hypothetical protein